MIISENTQLGLMFKRPEVKLDFLNLQRTMILNELEIIKNDIDVVRAKERELEDFLNSKIPHLTQEQIKSYFHENVDYKQPVTEDDEVFSKAIEIDKLLEDEDSKYFLITDSVYKCAELIRIKENFTGRTLKDIQLGKYTYLMGKHCMVRFYCGIGYIKGYYYNSKENISFDWRIAMATGNYYFPERFSKQFTQMMQVLTFVELGDIEIVQLNAGRNNGKPKTEGKVHNSSNNTVYVVDSTWNQLIIRTEGFAVRGHFRLQPCGVSHADRKLIWVDAFEKHGYKRKPKAEIIK